MKSDETTSYLIGAIITILLIMVIFVLLEKFRWEPNRERQQQERQQQYAEAARKYDWKITQKGETWVSDGEPYVATYRSAGRCVFTDKNSGTQVTIIGDFIVERIPENQD